MACSASCLCSKEVSLMTFEASLDDRVKISEHTGSRTKGPLRDQGLWWGSKTLKPQRRVSFHSTDEMTIQLTLKVVKSSDEELTLFLVELSNQWQRHLLQVWRSSSVIQVRKMMEVLTAITPEAQIVTCNGKRLENGKSMILYGIRKGSLPFLVHYSIGS
uniref:Ubiquitin D n=1 Tax=Chinchilla lanigera TaxID=34839 RepID=A0A8C2V2R5_CHILA